MTATAREILDMLRRSGFAVSASGSGLLVVPREKLTPADCQMIVENKASILTLLANEVKFEICSVCRGWCNPTAKDAVAAVCTQARCPYQVRTNAPERKPR